jgi:hypothetical protein
MITATVGHVFVDVFMACRYEFTLPESSREMFIWRGCFAAEKVEGSPRMRGVKWVK